MELQAVRDTYVATEPTMRAAFLMAMDAMDFTEALKAVDLPAVVAVGTHDRLTPPARGRRLAGALPRARLR
jgi:3-oxoadipate enol-lactonase